MWRTLAIDLSTKSGWAVFEGSTLVASGNLGHQAVDDFNVNDDPNHSPKYPWNIMDAAEQVSQKVLQLVNERQPNTIVIENTVRGRSRHSQRLLEWLHYALLEKLRTNCAWREVKYMDPSEWRKALDMRLSTEQKKNNRDVSAGKKRGRIGKKHLSVAMVNEKFGKSLKLKDNDEADAINLGLAFVQTKKELQST